jgi:hypothetical protein
MDETSPYSQIDFSRNTKERQLGLIKCGGVKSWWMRLYRIIKRGGLGSNFGE